MNEQLELFNTLTTVFLVLGICFAIAAVIIFLRTGIREYFALTHHAISKDTFEEKNAIYEDEQSISEPSDFLSKPELKIISDLHKEDNEKNSEEGAEETTVINNEGKEESSEETTAINKEDTSDGTEETTQIQIEKDENNGSGHTQDLCKPSAIKKEENYDEEDALTGVLDNDSSETAVLTQGEENTTVLKDKDAKHAKKNTIKGDILWDAPLSHCELLNIHNIVIVNTNRKINEKGECQNEQT